MPNENLKTENSEEKLVYFLLEQAKINGIITERSIMMTPKIFKTSPSPDRPLYISKLN